MLLRARAIETGAWLLAPAQGGLHADGRRTWGRTMAVSPWGEVVGMLDHDQPSVLEIEIDQKSVTDARARIPAWRQQ
ncbi:MAG: nitrilase-related carbon-nitrogen hydrolase [Pseudomonadota bacterium]